MKRGCYTDINLDRMRNKIGAMVYYATRSHAENVGKFAIKLSPVHTGAFRGSWFLSEGHPSYVYVGRQPGRHSPNPTPLPPPRLITRHISTKFYRKIHVTNGAPYSYRIEHLGWSPQAPNGVLKQAIWLAEQAAKFSKLPEIDTK